jgi:predicted DsbA family dithiol-disulfide isomerase
MANQIRATMNAESPLFFFYDYVDPASFVLALRLESEAMDTKAHLQLRPFEVNPPPHSLLDPTEGDWHDHWSRAMEDARDVGVELSRPWIVPWSRKAHELARHAEDHDRFLEIHNALFRAYLIEGKDIGRVDVLVALARESGLDPFTTKAALDVDAHTDEIEGMRGDGLERGVVRPPALRSGSRVLNGCPDTQELRRFLAVVAESNEP